MKSRFIKMARSRTIAVCVAGVATLVLAAAVWAAPAPSASPRPAAVPPVAANLDNSQCLACHATQGMTKALGDGEALDLHVDATTFAGSVHGQAGIGCTDCHSNITEFPHPKFSARDRRDVTLQLYANCRQCHEDKYQLTLDSTHQAALAGGNTNAAVCVDCHGAHDVRAITNKQTGKMLAIARVKIPETCARCHSAIYDQYRNSVHGSALIGEGNPDVPTCIDCHGVHNISDPTTAAFRLKSPQLCAKCHTDERIMSQYGISTQVLNTYVADFHGTTVTLFEKVTPDQQTNKPVCFDCHGVHNISRVDDPQTGLQVKENLLRTCQKCHPDATTNFPDAWLSHYVPTADKNPLVYYVNLFYKFFIPTVIGGMLVFVLSDIYRRLIERRKGAGHS